MAKALEVVAACRNAVVVKVSIAGEQAFRDSVRLALKAKHGAGIDPFDMEAKMVGILEESGRRLHWFVKQANILRQNAIISDDLFRDVVTETNGYRLWAEVWLPYLRSKPVDGQPPNHLEWADSLLKEYPPQSAPSNLD